MTIAIDRASEPCAGSDASAQPWQLGIVIDVAGHVHLGVVIEDGPGRPRQYVDLLAAVGDASVADVEHRVVIVTGDQLAQLGGSPNAASTTAVYGSSSGSSPTGRHPDDASPTRR